MQSVEEISPLIAPWVGDSGTCPDDAAAMLKAINEIRRLLWNKTDYTHTIEWVDICCVDKCFFLPGKYEVVRNVLRCGHKVDLQNEWYRTVVPDHVYCDRDINVMQDRGEYHSKFRNFPGEFQIEVQAEGNEDSGKVMQFESRTKNGTWLKQQITLGESFIPIRAPITVEDFSRVTKPKTSGRVRVYGYSPTTRAKLLLAIYQSWETNPSYKKYMLPKPNEPKTVTVRAKLRYVDLDNSLDLVEFPAEAMIQGANATTYRRSRDMEKYTQSMTMAVGELVLDMQSNETQGSKPLDMDTGGTVHSLIQY